MMLVTLFFVLGTALGILAAVLLIGWLARLAIAKWLGWD